MDMRKAFDSKHNGELIACKQQITLPVMYADWLCTYLGNHSQKVLVYKQAFLPGLDYCGYLYNDVTKYQHNRLQMSQIDIYVCVLM